MWGWIAWGIVVLAVWVAVAAFVGVLLGRAIRSRDGQIPRSSTASVPVHRAEAPRRPPVPGHRQPHP